MAGRDTKRTRRLRAAGAARHAAEYWTRRAKAAASSTKDVVYRRSTDIDAAQEARRDGTLLRVGLLGMASMTLCTVELLALATAQNTELHPVLGQSPGFASVLAPGGVPEEPGRGLGILPLALVPAALMMALAVALGSPDGDGDGEEDGKSAWDSPAMLFGVPLAAAAVAILPAALVRYGAPPEIPRALALMSLLILPSLGSACGTLAYPAHIAGRALARVVACTAVLALMAWGAVAATNSEYAAVVMWIAAFVIVPYTAACVPQRVSRSTTQGSEQPPEVSRGG